MGPAAFVAATAALGVTPLVDDDDAVLGDLQETTLDSVLGRDLGMTTKQMHALKCEGRAMVNGCQMYHGRRVAS